MIFSQSEYSILDFILFNSACSASPFSGFVAVNPGSLLICVVGVVD
jgi:hypothetical protein